MDVDDYRRGSHEVWEAMAPGWERWRAQLADALTPVREWLIRALEPTRGLDAMASRRGIADPRLLAAGPGRLAQALAITRVHDGLPLDRPPFELSAREDVEVETGRRVGITKAADRPWRYGEAGSKFLSRPLKPRPRA